MFDSGAVLQHGEDFLKEGGAEAGGGGMGDLFDMLSGQGRRQRKPTKSTDTKQVLDVNLKNFYLGYTKCAFDTRNGCSLRGIIKPCNIVRHDQTLLMRFCSRVHVPVLFMSR